MRPSSIHSCGQVGWFGRGPVLFLFFPPFGSRVSFDWGMAIDADGVCLGGRCEGASWDELAISREAGGGGSGFVGFGEWHRADMMVDMASCWEATAAFRAGPRVIGW